MKPFKLILLSLSIMVVAGGVGADQIYRWRDANGKIHFGDKPPDTHEATPVTVKPNLYHAPDVEVISGSGSTREKVVMYSTQRCGYCKKARQYFRRNAIPYTEYDVETSQKGKRDYKKLGGTGVPIILVGKRRLNGFNEASFREFYESQL